MSKKLVIVESPAKAKTINKYLGSDFVVKSSFGHVRDLPKKGVGIDKDNDFEPTYEINPDKRKVIAELRKEAKTASEVWLATDEDREGEAIAWHLAYALKIDPATTKRIVFHEITKSAIDAAVQSPRTIDQHLVDAQQARRIIDRLVGYELSPVLWKKVRPGLSAGRVQSVALRIIVDREREIENFEPVTFYKLGGEFLTSDKTQLPAEYGSKINTKEDTTTLLERLKEASFSVKAVEKKPRQKKTYAPLTTSTLQQAASSQLGFSVKQTMMVAQRLYESGKITYMRTDSLNLSQQAIKQAEEVIKSEFGPEYSKPTYYKTNKKGAQEAHEAIRPTDMKLREAGDDRNQARLYQLIRERTLASQMTPAKVEKTVVTIESSVESDDFSAKGEIVIFPGFMAALSRKSEDVILPELQIGDSVDVVFLEALQSASKPPARFSEAQLVKKMEELGIGRPSTYAPTISTLQTRGYIEKGESEGTPTELIQIRLEDNEVKEETITKNVGSSRGRLLPTDIALVVTDFLTKHFETTMDFGFTADVEARLDIVAEGEEEWVKLVRDIYDPFHKHVVAAEDVSREEVSQARELGLDPVSSKPIVVRFGRFGPMIQRGTKDDEEKPDFAPIPRGTDMNDVTLEQALELLKLPRTVGETEDGETITANFGRFGPYVKFGSTYVSIKDDDPRTITLDTARELIKLKIEEDAKKNIKEFSSSGIKVLNGRYGPYIKDGKKNVKIPKDIEPEEITEEQAKELIKNYKPGRRGGKKKAPVKKKKTSKK